jgi:hypothetical protein
VGLDRSTLTVPLGTLCAILWVSGCVVARDEAPGVLACGAAGCTCMPGYGDCGGGWEDGCETSLLTDATNCGRCGHDCRGGRCVDGVCQPVELASGVAPTAVSRLALAGPCVFVATGDGIVRAPRDVTAACPQAVSRTPVNAVAAAGDCLFWTRAASICQACGSDLLAAETLANAPCVELCETSCEPGCATIKPHEIAAVPLGPRGGADLFFVSSNRALLCRLPVPRDLAGTCRAVTCTSAPDGETSCPEGEEPVRPQAFQRIAAVPAADGASPSAFAVGAAQGLSYGVLLEWTPAAGDCAGGRCLTGICASVNMPPRLAGEHVYFATTDSVSKVAYHLRRVERKALDAGAGVAAVEEMACRRLVSDLEAREELHYATLGGAVGRLPLDGAIDAANASCEGLAPGETMFRDESSFGPLAVDDTFIFFVDVFRNQLLRLAR